MGAGLFLLGLFIAMTSWQAIRDSYDQERWSIDPYYPRYGATNYETLKWALQRLRQK
jgi:hypothetical protein